MAHGAAGYDGGRIVAEVVRYADIDYERGNFVRGHYFQAFLTGHDRPPVPGRYLVNRREAQAAVVAVICPHSR